MAFLSAAGLTLDNGHLDLSFSRREAWQKLEHAGQTHSSPNPLFLGDADAGPMVFLNAVSAGPVGVQTATHYHGSDQFRIILKGVEQSVSRLKFRPGEFAFQESGMPYKEGTGGAEETWAVLIPGDRRGLSAVFPLGDNATPRSASLENVTPELKAKMDAAFSMFKQMARNNPGGPKGIPAIASTTGQCRNGFLRGSFETLQGSRRLADGVVAAAGLWGNRSCGPALTLLKASPGHTVIPRLTTATETLLVIVDGSCTMGESRYVTGDVRIQAADVPRAAVVAGPEGLKMLFMIADRRALQTIEVGDDGGRGWGRSLEDLFGSLSAVLVAA